MRWSETTELRRAENQWEIIKGDTRQNGGRELEITDQANESKLGNGGRMVIRNIGYQTTRSCESEHWGPDTPWASQW